MRPSVKEQETIISIMRGSGRADIYTSSSSEIDKFREYAKENPETVGVRYSIPKSYITIRAKGSSMSEENRKAAGERLLAARKKAAEAKASAAASEANSGGGGSTGGAQPEKHGDGLPTDYGKGGRSKPPRPKNLTFFDKSLER